MDSHIRLEHFTFFHTVVSDDHILNPSFRHDIVRHELGGKTVFPQKFHFLRLTLWKLPVSLAILLSSASTVPFKIEYLLIFHAWIQSQSFDPKTPTFCIPLSDGCFQNSIPCQSEFRLILSVCLQQNPVLMVREKKKKKSFRLLHSTVWNNEIPLILEQLQTRSWKSWKKAVGFAVMSETDNCERFTTSCWLEENCYNSLELYRIGKENRFNIEFRCRIEKKSGIRRQWIQFSEHVVLQWRPFNQRWWKNKHRSVHKSDLPK
jgi:hypothetical protein